LHLQHHGTTLAMQQLKQTEPVRFWKRHWALPRVNS
jgi:hypothetical protein